MSKATWHQACILLPEDVDDDGRGDQVPHCQDHQGQVDCPEIEGTALFFYFDDCLFFTWCCFSNWLPIQSKTSPGQRKKSNPLEGLKAHKKRIFNLHQTNLWKKLQSFGKNIKKLLIDQNSSVGKRKVDVVIIRRSRRKPSEQLGSN